MRADRLPGEIQLPKPLIFPPWRWRPMPHGFPPMAMVRIVGSTFLYPARHADPGAATVTAIVCNILLEVALVWSVGFRRCRPGSAGQRLLGAWINVAVLTWYGHSFRDLLAIEKAFVPFCARMPPVLLAPAVTGVSASVRRDLWRADAATGRYADLAGLFLAMVCAGGVSFCRGWWRYSGTATLGRLSR